MNNKQLFDLISPPSEDFDTAQELLRYCKYHAKQNGHAVATKNSKREKYITIKCNFRGTYWEVQKHPIAEKRMQTSSRLNHCPSEKNGKKWWWKLKICCQTPNHNHPASPPEAYQMHWYLDDTGCCCGHCVVRGTGPNSKTCPDCTRIMVIKRPVLEEPAMIGSSNADPVSSNNSCSRKRRTVICVNCGGNHYRNTPCWNRNL